MFQHSVQFPATYLVFIVFLEYFSPQHITQQFQVKMMSTRLNITLIWTYTSFVGFYLLELNSPGESIRYTVPRT